MLDFKALATRAVHIVFSRWRFLTLYLAFAVIAISGWYIDIVGWFSSAEDYAASVKAQYGDINILNVLVFITGSVVFLGYLWADVKNKRLEKMITGDVNITNRSVLGNANQAISSGENSPAVNASEGPVIINYGITEERCRTIFDEKLSIALQNYSAEAVFVAKERTFKFRQKLVPRLGEEENGFESFTDPSFQFLLIEAQKAAASSNREADYDILSEMLATRVKMGNNRELHIGINKAVDMLPYVSDSQLAGITVAFCLTILSPRVNNINEALSIVNDVYGKIIGDVELPSGRGWLESLEAGGLVKNVGLSMHSFKPFREIILSSMERFTCTGIKKDSERYKEAVKVLQEGNLPASMILEHELNSDFVRLYPMDVNSINDVALNVNKEGTIETIPLSDEQKKCVKRIFDLYEGEYSLREDFKNRFINKCKDYLYLKIVMEWWDKNTSLFFEQTIVGKILSNANANKCDARIPIFVK